MAYTAKRPRVYISQRGGRKKIYKNEYVYLRDQDEFDIELSNPTKDTILAKIELNGKSISNSGLVLRPGENFVLRRFIDTNGKFVFNTYDIDGSDSEMSDAIAENGKLKVLFYKEKTVKPIYCPPQPWYPNQPYYVYPSYYSYPYCGGTGIVTNSGTSTVTLQNNGASSVQALNISSDTIIGANNSITYGDGIAGSSADVDVNGGAFGSVSYSTSNFTSNTGHTLGDLGFDFEGVLNDDGPKEVELDLTKSLDKSLEDTIETGRIEAGSSTDQSFDYVNMDFETNVSYTSELTMLPESRQPIAKADLNKVFCHKCGRKAKQDDNFCSDCGTKLNV